MALNIDAITDRYISIRRENDMDRGFEKWQIQPKRVKKTSKEPLSLKNKLKRAENKSGQLALEYEEHWNSHGEACEHAVRRMELNEENIATLKKKIASKTKGKETRKRNVMGFLQQHNQSIIDVWLKRNPGKKWPEDSDTPDWPCTVSKL